MALVKSGRGLMMGNFAAITSGNVLPKEKKRKDKITSVDGK
jgi:hypothetical protein